MKRTTGKYESATVAGEEVQAFIPYPLPPKRPALQMDPAMAEALGGAEAALARLAVAGEMVPSLDWLVYAFVRKEAVLSSQIEGTQASPMRFRPIPMSTRWAITCLPFRTRGRRCGAPRACRSASACSTGRIGG